MDPLTIGMLVVLAVLVFFMFRNNRKRKQMMEELQSKMVPGVRVMTNFGLYGTLRSVDESANEAELEIAPGTIVTVHRQTLSKVVDEVAEGQPRSVEEAMEIANREQAERDGVAADQAEPEFGERVTDEPAKPARRTAKKPTE